jgi:hypothetical protein
VKLGVPGDKLGGVRMRIRPGALVIRLQGKTVATIDTKTLEVKH